MPDQPGVPQARPGSTGTDDLAIPGGEDDRGSPPCIGTPDRPGVPQRPGSTGADDLALKLLVRRSSAKNRNNATPSRDQFLEPYGQPPLSGKRA